MNISSVQPWKNITNSEGSSTQDVKTSFKDLLKETLNDVNDLQLAADNKVVNFTAGNSNTDIHDVMISMEKAQLALSLTIEIRNKLVESYQEIMRMQV